jgi:hypothetical protein
MAMRWLIFTLGVLALTGCGTDSEDEAPRFSVAAVPKTPGYATLVVYRQGITPYRRGAELDVNGQEAMSLDAFTFTLILAKPGHVHIHSSWAFDLLYMPTGDVDLDVQAGQIYYFEITPDLVQEDPATAVGPLQQCCRYEPVSDSYRPAGYSPPAD